MFAVRGRFFLVLDIGSVDTGTASAGSVAASRFAISVAIAALGSVPLLI